MSIAIRFLCVVAAAACLGGLGGCKSASSDEPVSSKSFIVVGERTYAQPLDFMYTMARRTMRDLNLARETMTKNDTEAFIVFQAPEAEFDEMAMQIRPEGEGEKSSHVTIFAHRRNVLRAVDRILDDLQLQITAERDVLHKKPK